jgi:hypothetical protein
MSSADYLAHMAAQTQKKAKYLNKWVKFEGQNFQSQAECDRYQVLLLQMKAGFIFDLERQKLFKLMINGVLITTYRCDFFYKTLEGGFKVEDVKGFITEEYLIKKRLMKVIYVIDISEPNLSTPATKRSRNKAFYKKK